MLIKPFLQSDGSLFLDAYSWEQEDFKQVKEIIKEASIKPEAHDMENPGRRINKRFVIDKKDVSKLELSLQAKFVKDVHINIVEFDNEGNPYECHELKEDGGNGNSVKFLAKDPRVAAVKAGLIANNNHWYDADVHPFQKNEH